LACVLLNRSALPSPDFGSIPECYLNVAAERHQGPAVGSHVSRRAQGTNPQMQPCNIAAPGGISPPPRRPFAQRFGIDHPPVESRSLHPGPPHPPPPGPQANRLGARGHFISVASTDEPQRGSAALAGTWQRRARRVGQRPNLGYSGPKGDAKSKEANGKIAKTLSEVADPVRCSSGHRVDGHLPAR